MMKYFWSKIFTLSFFIALSIFSFFSFSPAVTFADAPPPPPFKIIFTSSGVPISVNANNVSVLLGTSQKQDKASDCSLDTCYFSRVFLMGNFKVSVNDPTVKKTYVTNEMNREYLGHYGRDTVTTYHVDLQKDGSARLFTTGDKNDDPYPPVDDGPGVSHPTKAIKATDPPYQNYTQMVLIPLLGTLILEIIVAGIFILFKKAPKRILLGVLIGNIISVPILWALVLRSYSMLFPAEILAVIFEAWMLRIFSRKKLSWKMCLLISLIMNLASFILGPLIFH